MRTSQAPEVKHAYGGEKIPILQFEISGEKPQLLPQFHSRRMPKGRVRR
jgi:hypothetical protein